MSKVKSPDIKAPKINMPEWAFWAIGTFVLFVLVLGGTVALNKYRDKSAREEYKIQSGFPDEFFAKYNDGSNAGGNNLPERNNYMNPFSEEEIKEAERIEKEKAEKIRKEQAKKAAAQRARSQKKTVKRDVSKYFAKEAPKPLLNRRSFGETRVSLKGVNGELVESKSLKTWKNVDKEVASYPLNMERVITVDKRIPAILIEEINSELPGKVTAVIEENIYGGHGRKILIPAGTKAVGNYDPLKRIGEERLEILWTRLITPDGVNIMVESEMTDQMGRSGLTGDVDKRYFERYGIAVLVSMINSAALYQVPVDNQNQALVVNNFSGELSSISNTILKEHINIKPRVKIKAGARILISPTKDIWFKYSDASHAEIAEYKGAR